MTAPIRPLDKERSYALKLLCDAGLDLAQADEQLAYLLAEGHPYGLISLVAGYGRSLMRDMRNEDGSANVGRIAGFLRGGCERQRAWLIDDLQAGGWI